MLAYDVVVNGSIVAKQKLRELEDEPDRLADEIHLLDCAFWEAVKRTTQRKRMNGIEIAERTIASLADKRPSFALNYLSG
jgi:hypothetical protein